MKKIWTKPMATVEEFAANEYVAACYEIACSIGAEGGNFGKRDTCCGHSHTKKDNGSGCGWAANQNIQVTGSGENAVFSIVEINNDSYDDLTCYFYDPANPNGPAYETITGLEVGDTVYWKTNVGVMGRVVWMHHKGTYTLQDAAHPLRS